MMRITRRLLLGILLLTITWTSIAQLPPVFMGG